MKGSTLTATRLRELLHYNPTTGHFTARFTRGRQKAGAAVGTPNSDGYLVIRVDGVQHKAHRLAWLYVTGEWPKGVIDHKNQVKTENWWDNLRDVTRKYNNQNVHSVRKDNSSGFPGVSPSKNGKRWLAQVRVNGKPSYIGTYDTPEEAHAEYLKAKAANQNGFIPGAAANA